jgi:YYY domain-containing protein
VTETLRFLVVLEGLGLAALPLTAKAFARLPGAGLGLSKVLGLLLLGWLVWMLGSIGVPYGVPLLVVGCVALAAAGALTWRRRPLAPDDFARRLWVRAEVLFVVSFLVGVLYASFSPDVWGTEKPMDMALINAVNASHSFPPHDPWMSGEQLNYYYLGHLLLALLVRLTNVEPSAGYNLALATVFALSATAAFTVASTIAETARRQGASVRAPLAAGAAAVVLLVLMGSLRAGWDVLHVSGPLKGYDWFSASRVIPNTINEFPYFSFTVGDLHAHLLALPLTLLALLFIAQAGAFGPPGFLRVRGWWETFCVALSIGILYAVNSWSWPVMVGLFGLCVVVWVTGRDAVRRRKRALVWAAGVVALGIALIVPFIVHFDPNARGFALVTENQREPLWKFLGHHLVIEGVLLWLLLAPLAGRLRFARHRMRIVVWGLAAAVVVLSLLAGTRLAGAAIFVALSFVALDAALSRSLSSSERLLWAVFAAGLACIAGPEIVIIRDDFADTRYIRMNTVFKMGYQAWILLAIGGAVALAMGRTWLPRLPRMAWQVVAAGLVAISLAFTVGGAYARKQGFSDGPRLDGRRWLARMAPGDVRAIDWIRSHTAGDAVMLEAFGGDYAEFGNARISVYTGRPTVMGWQGHEIQWSHDIGTRAQDVAAMYKGSDPAQVKALLDRYRVRYAVVGPLERTTYGSAAVLRSLGRKVFDRGGTAVYRYTPPPRPPRRKAPERGLPF